MNVQPNLPVGKYELTSRMFRSRGSGRSAYITPKVYFQQNDLNAYSLNNLTAKPNSDGSYTLRFGGCTRAQKTACRSWKAGTTAVRMYEPGEQIINGSWVFPGPPTPRSR